jgi:hypothetical protein
VGEEAEWWKKRDRRTTQRGRGMSTLFFAAILRTGADEVQVQGGVALGMVSSRPSQTGSYTCLPLSVRGKTRRYVITSVTAEPRLHTSYLYLLPSHVGLPSDR